MHAAVDFYNSSSGAGEIAPYTGTPYGFFHRPLPHFAAGFPAVFDNRLLANGSLRLWTVLSEGNYLDSQTASLTARLLTFNEELQVYGSAVWSRLSDAHMLLHMVFSCVFHAACIPQLCNACWSLQSHAVPC